MTYDEIIARIDKAEGLPEDVRRKHIGTYIDLCRAAAECELNARRFPAHAICDRDTRALCGDLLRRVYALTRLPADAPAEDFRAATQSILADLMALAATPDERVLEIWGYKEVAEDDEKRG